MVPAVPSSSNCLAATSTVKRESEDYPEQMTPIRASDFQLGNRRNFFRGYAVTRCQNSLKTTLSKKANALTILPSRRSRNQAYVLA